MPLLSLSRLPHAWRRFLRLLFLALMTASKGAQVNAQSVNAPVNVAVNVAVAANFASTLQKIASGFTQDTGFTLRATSGSSGKFAAQIQNNAPFHVLLSADAEGPTRLVSGGFAVAASRFTYALGRLVLYSADPQRIDGRPEVLRRGEFKHLAIANPAVAPYGAAAMQTLDKLSLSAALKPKLVQGENIAQTYQFVHSGNAELGFVALSQVMEDGQLTAKGSMWLVSPSLHQPIRQDAVLLKAAQNHPGALALMQYLQGDKARALIQAAGYALPAGKN